MKRKPPVPKIVWREGFFIARTDFGKRKTPAMIHGPLAIHKDFRWGREWVVSSVSTGLIIWTFFLDHEEEAYKCAETLLRYARKEFMMDHPKLLKRKLPTWLIKWIYSVKRHGAWLPTKKYREKYEGTE